MLRHFFKYFFLFFLLLACTVKSVPVPQNKIERLTVLLQTLDSSTMHEESRVLAEDIFKETQSLVKRFELTSPPLWHNFLVNIGMRDKGLCYHWSDALYLHLQQKNYKHFSFHLVGSNIGEYFSEHNALLIGKKGSQTIKGGVIIDPWRESGKLFFTKVDKDKKYIWEHRKEREPFFFK